jgi:hypothetical protein
MMKERIGKMKIRSYRDSDQEIMELAGDGCPGGVVNIT